MGRFGPRVSVTCLRRKPRVPTERATLRALVGLILDLAVVALALAVIGSLALLAWTLAVSAVRATRDQRREVASLRQRVADADERLRLAAARAGATLERLTDEAAGATGDHRDR